MVKRGEGKLSIPDACKSSNGQEIPLLPLLVPESFFQIIALGLEFTNLSVAPDAFVKYTNTKYYTSLSLYTVGAQ